MTNEEWVEWIMRSIAERDKKIAALGSKLPELDIFGHSTETSEANAKMAQSKAETDAAMKHLAASMTEFDGLVAALKGEWRSNNIDGG